MGKRHATGSDHHQDAKYALDSNEMLLFLGLGIGLDAVDEECADEGNADSDCNGQNVTVAKTDCQAYMLEAFQDRHQRDRKGRQEHVDRDVAPSSTERVFVTQNQFLHAEINQERDKTGGHRRNHPAHDDRADLAPLHGIDANADSCETHDCADDRVRGGDGPAIGRGDEQPDAGGQQGGQHAVDQEFGRA